MRRSYKQSQILSTKYQVLYRAARPRLQELRIFRGINSVAVWSEATIKTGLRASPACAASPPHQVLRNVHKDVTLKRFGAQRHKKRRPACAGLQGLRGRRNFLVVVVVADRDHRVRTGIEEHQTAYADGGSGYRRSLQSRAVGERDRHRGGAAQRTESGR